MEILRKYGEPTTVVFPLISGGSTEFCTTASFAAGDSQISKDEGAFANTSGTPSHIGNGMYSLGISGVELQASRVMITIIDQTATKIWEDQSIILSTYGNASAQHAFDMNTATQDVNVTTIEGSDATDTISGQALNAITSYDPPTRTELTSDKQEIINSGNASWITADLSSLNDPTATQIAGEVLASGNAAGWSDGATAGEVWANGTRTLTDYNESAIAAEVVSSGNSAGWDVVTVSGLTPDALSQIVASGDAANWDAIASITEVTVSGLTSTALSQIVTSGDAANWDATTTEVTVSGLTPGALGQIVSSGNAANWGGIADVSSLATTTDVTSARDVIIASGQANWITATVAGLSGIYVDETSVSNGVDSSRYNIANAIYSGVIDGTGGNQINLTGSIRDIWSYSRGEIDRVDASGLQTYKDPDGNDIWTSTVTVSGRTIS